LPNETYEIEVGSPLLRPGITIRTYVSKKYVASTTKDLLNIIREINEPVDNRTELQRRTDNYNLLTTGRLRNMEVINNDTNR